MTPIADRLRDIAALFIATAIMFWPVLIVAFALAS